MNQQEFMDGIARWQGQVEQRAAAIAAEFGIRADGTMDAHRIPIIAAKPSKSVAKRKAAQKAPVATSKTAARFVAGAPAGGAAERILGAIATAAATTTRDLVATLGLGESTVANALTALVRSGAVRRVGIGKYAAVSK